MNTQRVTISLPKYLYYTLTQQIPQGQVSSFVAQAIERELIDLGTDPIKEFVELKKRLPKRTRLSIIKAIKKGRA